jgi:hypothetical protein
MNASPVLKGKDILKEFYTLRKLVQRRIIHLQIRILSSLSPMRASAIDSLSALVSLDTGGEKENTEQG